MMRGSRDPLALRLNDQLTALNAGLFISRGEGIHPDRTIDSWELILVRSGELAIQENGRQFHVHPNETLLLFPGRRHRGIEPYPTDLSFYWIHFTITRASRSSGKAISLPQHAAVRRPDRLTELLHRYLDDQEEGTLSPISATSLVRLMLCEVAMPAGSSATAPGGILAARAEACIAAHAHRPISTSSIARTLQCNADYLGRAYRQAFGHTLTEAIHRRRCRDARKLLLETMLGIRQIAVRCGFSSAGYFRRVFLRIEGLSPRRYRQLHRRTHINWR